MLEPHLTLPIYVIPEITRPNLQNDVKSATLM